MPAQPNTPVEAPSSTPTGLNALRPRLMYTAFHVSDIERALAFYVGALGMRESTRIELASGEQECVLEYADSKGGGVILMWWPGKPAPRTHGDGYSRLVLKVSDLDAAVEHVRAQGVAISKPPTEGPGLRYAMLRDPDGYLVELVQFIRR